MTEAETALWARLGRKQLWGFQFNRQKPLGRFIVDFYCLRANLVIELDGGQHYIVQGQISDGLRDVELREMGLYVMRFSNLDVLNNLDGVLTTITNYLEMKFNKRETKSP